jgi:hypothetical protein
VAYIFIGLGAIALLLAIVFAWCKIVHNGCMCRILSRRIEPLPKVKPVESKTASGVTPLQ